jgi:hypothetical protein
MSASGGKLSAVTKVLSSQWQQTKESWKDAKAQEFERQYLDELFTSVDKAVGIMDQVEKLVAKIRSDCE